MRRHLLVTNDFPPKIGGIQNYLWELWRRLEPEATLVYTTPHPDAVAFDARQPFAVERPPSRGWGRGRGWCPASGIWPTGTGPTSCSSTRPSRSGPSPPASADLTASCSTAPR